jgi:hypothetical protein
MPNQTRGTPCEGWWDQLNWGRQQMSDLYLEFSAGAISGSGADVVGPFLFKGKIDAQGQVAMTKDYVGQHSVDYRGNYDGEGLLWGQWRVAGMTDRWLIRLKPKRAMATHAAETAEDASALVSTPSTTDHTFD